jgi:hypothetical protein
MSNTARLSALERQRTMLLEQAALTEAAGPEAEAGERALAEWDAQHGAELEALRKQGSVQ